MMAKGFPDLEKKKVLSLGLEKPCRISKSKYILSHMIVKPQNIKGKDNIFKHTREYRKTIFKDMSTRLISPLLLATIAARR